MNGDPAVDYDTAHRELRADPTLGPVVARNGRIDLEPADDFFVRVCRSVVRQQISMRAADAIFDRLQATVPLSPAEMKTIDEAILLDTGLSRAKATTLVALATQWENQDWDRSWFATLDNDEVTDALTDVKGIGPWTAKMALLFGLGRPDIWPVEDLGIRRGMDRLFEEDLTRAQMRDRAKAWRPYRSIAALHLWQIEDSNG